MTFLSMRCGWTQRDQKAVHPCAGVIRMRQAPCFTSRRTLSTDVVMVGAATVFLVSCRSSFAAATPFQSSGSTIPCSIRRYPATLSLDLLDRRRLFTGLMSSPTGCQHTLTASLVSHLALSYIYIHIRRLRHVTKYHPPSSARPMQWMRLTASDAIRRCRRCRTGRHGEYSVSDDRHRQRK